MKFLKIPFLSLLLVISTTYAQDIEKSKALLADFNYKTAFQIMNQKKIPLSDRDGYLKFLQRKHIMAKDPSYFKHSGAKTVNIVKNSKGQTTFSTTCNNIGFDDETFTNWTGATGDINVSTWTNGLVSDGPNANIFDPNARHTILTTPPTNDVAPNVVGYDSLAVNPGTGKSEIPFLAPGGGFVSVRLGNANTGNETERLRYTFAVTASSAQLTYFYAVVLQDGLHNPGEQSFFRFNLFDSNNNKIGGNCGTYQVDASVASADTSFRSITYNGEGLYYKRWTPVSVDLTPFIGQTITAEFQTADCIYGGHFGYAYIDLSCAVLEGSVGFCTGDTKALLIAPGGYSTYQWYDASNTAIAGPKGKNDSLIVTNPTLGDIYTVKMTTVTGCQTTVKITITISTLTAKVIQSASCVDGKNGFATVYPVGGSSAYTYSWNTTPPQTTQTATGLGAGTYIVKVSQGNCTPAFDTVKIGTKVILPTSSLAYFCPGSKALAIAPYYYSLDPSHTWYLGNSVKGNNDTLVITSPVKGQIYVDSIQDTYGCRLSHKVTLDTTSISIDYIYGSDSICWGTKSGYVVANATSTAPLSFTWSTAPPQKGSGGNAYASNLTSGTYTVTFTSNGSCATSSSFKIGSLAQEDTTIKVPFKCGDTKFRIIAPACSSVDTVFGFGCNYFWVGVDGDTIKENPYTYDSIFNYKYYKNLAGDTLKLTSLPKGNSVCLWKYDYNISYCPRRYCYQFVPSGTTGKTLDSLVNVFSPNGDGMNDKYYPYFSGAVKYPYEGFFIEKFSITIYNRWGQIVYKSEDFKEGWDGKLNGGSNCDDGVYFWVATYVSSCDDSKTEVVRKGNLQLIR